MTCNVLPDSYNLMRPALNRALGAALREGRKSF